MKVSIVIATYEAKGRAVYFLEELLNSILSQTYKNIEVVISDHSSDFVIKRYLNNWKKKLDIVYKKNSRGIGNSSINMNEGIKISTGEFIKIMHLDDKFCNDKIIEKLVFKIQEDESFKWGAFGFNHFYESENSIRREIIPKFYKNNRMDAESLIGCPSVSFFVNDNNFFDENMIIANDFDMHYRLNKKYGKPLIIPDVSVTIRIHSGQVTNSLSTYNVKEAEEMDYFKEKNK